MNDVKEKPGKDDQNGESSSTMMPNHNNCNKDTTTGEPASSEGPGHCCTNNRYANNINAAGETVEVEGGLKSREPTSMMGGAAATGDPSALAASWPKKRSQSYHPLQPADFIYGRPIQVPSSGADFPKVGSVLGPFFCLGQLGKGTFSSVHKCINMQYFHSSQQTERRRVAAAKVELADFQQSGVMQAESTALDFLSRSTPPGTVPVYMGHYKSDKFAAILMEYLPGQDMNHLREHIMNQHKPIQTRRIAIRDAVYLCGEVMLPLLQRMHNCGIIHRDVKPSNCVRCGSSGGTSPPSLDSESCRDFCMIDFGLSKSIVVPEDSPIADREHPWPTDRAWMRPKNFAGRGCFRQPRALAEFRGTSMYASLRVHQEQDYCPRDDIWSLLYVFCDMVSGGLPWMQNAANRDRAGCFAEKVRIHGDLAGDGEDDFTEELLKGDIYHIYNHHEKNRKEASSASAEHTKKYQPLQLSKDVEKVRLLRKAFKHLATLEFYDLPDYEFIRNCIRGFLKEPLPTEDPCINPADWRVIDERMMMSPENKRSGRILVPQWDLADDQDPLDEGIFEDAEEAAREESRPGDHLSRLPVETRFRLAQLEYNLDAHKSGTLPLHRALRDWMQCVLSLLYEDWNARRYEDGGHRTSTDGFKREVYLRLLQKCESYARTFGNFTSREYYYKDTQTSEAVPAIEGNESSTETTAPKPKKRKIDVKYFHQNNSRSSDLVFVSRAIFGIKCAIRTEKTKKPAPPVPLSFGT